MGCPSHIYIHICTHTHIYILKPEPPSLGLDAGGIPANGTELGCAKGFERERSLGSLTFNRPWLPFLSLGVVAPGFVV